LPEMGNAVSTRKGRAGFSAPVHENQRRYAG